MSCPYFFPNERKKELIAIRATSAPPPQTKQTNKKPKQGTSHLQYFKLFGAMDFGEGNIWQFFKKVLLAFSISSAECSQAIKLNLNQYKQQVKPLRKKKVGNEGTPGVIQDASVYHTQFHESKMVHRIFVKRISIVVAKLNVF